MTAAVEQGAVAGAAGGAAGNACEDARAGGGAVEDDHAQAGRAAHPRAPASAPGTRAEPCLPAVAAVGGGPSDNAGALAPGGEGLVDRPRQAGRAARHQGPASRPGTRAEPCLPSPAASGKGSAEQPPPPDLPAHLLADAALRRVLTALAPRRALIVGGAVRNALLGQPLGDIDIATDALPAEVTERAVAAGLRAVPTGIEHGTVTVVAEGRGFEVTTFRRDVATDGRRAVVAFSTRIEDDAARRDFTMNALYADPDGKVLDPVGGLPDLLARRLRFVGDPDARIAEDYLRILRFFRFHARYGRPGAADPAALAACARGAPELARLSRERVGAELRKLLSAPDPRDALTLMEAAGVLQAVLPGARLAPALALIATARDWPVQPHDPAHDWPVRLAALSARDPAAALRLSRNETRVQDELAFAGPLAEAAWRMGPLRARQIAALRNARGEALPADWEDDIAAAAQARFPLSAAALMPALSGPALGLGLRAAEAAWIGSGFSLGAAALMDIALAAGGYPPGNPPPAEGSH